jgi:hypothetical protein
VAPASASAAFGVVNVKAQPADTAAGAHSNFVLHAEFSQPADKVKDLIVHLPAGLLGDPNATPRCSRADFDGDRCPANTQIGTAATTATTLAGSSVSPGIVYNLAPSGSEPARLGMTFTPLGGAFGKLRTEAVASVRPTDSGLDTTISNLPQSFMGISLSVTAVDVTLFGVAGSPAKPFMTNPTSCLPATTIVEARSYANPGVSVMGSDTFTPTNCSALPYAPKFSATLTGVKERGHPVLRTIITQQPGEANTRRTVVTLPKAIGANLTTLGLTCPTASYNAGTCSPKSLVGTVTASTPIFSQPLAGTVRIVASATVGHLPDLILALTGPISLTLRAQSGLTSTGQLQTIFPAIADVPISRLALTLTGGAGGLLNANSDLCPATLPLKGQFTAHSGAFRTSVVAPTLTGCKLAGVAKLTGTARKKPVLAVSVSAGNTSLRSVSLTLPSSLKAPAARRTRTVVAKSGARALTFRLAGSSLTLAKPLRKGSTVRIVAQVRDVAGKSHRLSLPARVG